MIDHCGKSVTKMLPRWTSICDLKKKKLFNGGQEKYSPDLFTLSHDEVILQNNLSLDDYCFPGDEVVLQISSIKIFLANKCSKRQKVVMLNTCDVEKASSVITRFLSAEHGIDIRPAKLFLVYGNSWLKYTETLFPPPLPGQEILWYCSQVSK